MTQQVALVTGASSGIGEETARRIASRGFTVYGAARRADRLASLAPDGIRPLVMDVADDDSVTQGIAHLLDEAGRIDLLVNSAGYGTLGSVEETPIDDARRLFDVNLFGAMRLVQLVVPQMRQQRSGRIVNVSSVGGRVPTPLGSWYHGSKFALEAMSDTLRFELQQFGIDVVVIEPGGTQTEWAEIAVDHIRSNSGDGAYARQAEAVARSLVSERARASHTPASLVADTIVRAATVRRPKTRYPVGPGVKLGIALRRILPDRAFDRVMSRASGVPLG
ncbi:oxidoreductase [Dactylosporangium sp. NPDC005572]|uniref:oxidoreductase n=1 Tax=Dactylosporangium sp. NPDC005572 TaxID=3156889 RepID=UPI00339E2762